MKTKPTLKEYIRFVGIEVAADLFECSHASTKAWMYDLRQPSIKQAKKIILKTRGRLDIWSIFGPLEELNS